MRHTPSRRHESCSTSQAARVIRKTSDPGSSERRGYTQADAQIRYADRRAKRYDKRARRGDTQTDSQKGIINESYADRLAKQYYNRARRGNTQTDRLTHSDPGIVVLFGKELLDLSDVRARGRTQDSPHAGTKKEGARRIHLAQERRKTGFTLVLAQEAARRSHTDSQQEGESSSPVTTARAVHRLRQ